MSTPTPGRLMLNNVRIAFCQSLHKPEQVNGEGGFRRGAVLLIDKADPQVKAIERAIDQVLAIKYPDPKKRAPAESEMRKKDRIALRDGDDKAEKYDGFGGCMALSANGKAGDTAEEAGPVILLDQLKQPLTPGSGKPYAGCYVNASVELWVQDNQWGKRVNCTLRGVQFLRDGDAFGGGAPASADEFDTVTEGADAADFA